MKHIGKILLAAVIAAALTGCSSSPSATTTGQGSAAGFIPGTLRVADIEEPDTLNPYISTVITSIDLSYLWGEYFYNVDAYFHFVDQARKHGIRVPIVPGIMPIGNFSQLARFSEACGAEIPRWMRIQLEGYRDDVGSIRAFGLDVVTDLCRRLLAGGAPGLHFYTLNQATLSAEIWKRLGL